MREVPNSNIIVSTHSYLKEDGTTISDTDTIHWAPNQYFTTPLDTTVTNSGTSIWNALKGEPNLRIIVSGHDFHQPYFSSSMATGTNGNPVIQARTDFQGSGDEVVTFLDVKQSGTCGVAVTAPAPCVEFTSHSAAISGNRTDTPIVGYPWKPLASSTSLPPAAPPTISSFAASPSAITAGQSTTLSWNVSNAASLSISGIGAVSGSSIGTAPAQTTTYTLTASNSAGSVTATTTVTVTAAPPPTTAPSVAPAGYWSFDSGTISGSTVADGSGNNMTGTMNGGVIPVAGKVNQALSFNGSNGYLSFVNSSLAGLTGNLTLAAWIRTTNTSRAEALISKYDATGWEYGYIFKTLPGGNLGIRFGGSDLSSGNRENADTSGKTVNDGQWHHVAAVITLGQSVAFYVDGQLGSTVPVGTVAVQAGGLEVGASVWPPYGNYFTGQMDEVKIFDSALSASDIASLYGGTVTVTPLSLPTITSFSASPASITAGQSSTLSWNVSNAASLSISGIGAVSGSSVSTVPTQTTTYTLTASNSAGSVTATTTVTVTAVSAPPTTTSAVAPAGYWSFDSSTISGSTVTDSSGNSMTGTMHGGVTPVSGKVNQAVSFNGSNGYLSFINSNPAGLIGNLTLAAWIQTTNASRAEALISKYDATGWEYGYVFKTLATGNLGIRFGGSNLSWGNRENVDTSGIKINDGQWHHVAAVITLGQNVAFYIDGQLASTVPVGTVAGQGGSLEAGASVWPPYGNYFTGQMDELKVFNQALTAAQVAAVFSGK